MLEEPPTETPLGDLLPLRVKAVLNRNGIHTVEAVQQAYPHRLLKMWGMGMFRFKQIEAAFFPGKSFTPARIYSPIRHIKDSSLNGALSPVTVQVLSRAGIRTMEQLIATDLNVLMDIRGLGVHKLREIERAVHSSRTSTSHPLESPNGNELAQIRVGTKQSLDSQNPLALNLAVPVQPCVPDHPENETPLGDLLSGQVKSALERNGIHTVEGVRRAYPHALFEMRGI